MKKAEKLKYLKQLKEAMPTIRVLTSSGTPLIFWAEEYHEQNMRYAQLVFGDRIGKDVVILSGPEARAAGRQLQKLVDGGLLRKAQEKAKRGLKKS